MIALRMLIPALLQLWAGAGFLAACKLDRRFNLGEYLPLAYLSGAVLTGIYGLLQMALGAHFGMAGTIVILASLGCFAVREWPRRFRELRMPRVATWTVLLPGLLLALAALKPIVEMQHLPLLGWDTRKIWAFKARVIQSEGTTRVPAFEDPYRVHLQPAYPVLVPILQAFSADFGPEGDDRGFKAPVVFCSIAALGLLYGFLRREGHGAALAMAGAAMLAWLPLWASGIEVTLPEVVTASFELAAAGLFLQSARRDEHQLLTLGLFFAIAGALTKQEGAVFFLLYFLACMVLFGSRRYPLLKNCLRSPAVLTALGGLLAWQALAARLPFDFTPDYAGLLLAGQWSVSAAKLWLIARECARWTLLPSYWGFLFPLALLSLLRQDRPARLLAMLLALYTIAFVPAFVVSSWRPLEDHIRIAFPRVLLQIAPVAVLLVADWGAGLLTTKGNVVRAVREPPLPREIRRR